MKKNRDGSVKMEEIVRDDGCINPSFMLKHNLSSSSTPTNFMEALFPYENNLYSTKRKEYFSIKQLTKVL